MALTGCDWTRGWASYRSRGAGTQRTERRDRHWGAVPALRFRVSWYAPAFPLCVTGLCCDGDVCPAVDEKPTACFGNLARRRGAE